MSIWTDLTDIDFRLDWINAGGVKTRALIAGEGEDVIFMHGTSGHQINQIPIMRSPSTASMCSTIWMLRVLKRHISPVNP